MFSLFVIALFATSIASAHDCTKDRILERSCNQIVECKGGKVSTTTCKSGEVINFGVMKCQPVAKVPPPCGQVVDCSKIKDGKYAEIKQKCTTYYTCLAHHFVGHNVCPKGLVFSNVDEACDFPSNVAPPCGTKTF